MTCTLSQPSPTPLGVAQRHRQSLICAHTNARHSLSTCAPLHHPCERAHRSLRCAVAVESGISLDPDPRTCHVSQYLPRGYFRRLFEFNGMFGRLATGINMTFTRRAKVGKRRRAPLACRYSESIVRIAAFPSSDEIWVCLRVSGRLC